MSNPGSIYKVKYLFLDTEAYVHANFSFGGPKLGAVRQLCKEKRIHLLITDITKREVLKQITERVKMTASRVKKVNKEAYILRNVSSPTGTPILQFIDVEWATEYMHKALEEFLLECGVEELPTVSISSSEVFDLYFAQQAPFGPGQKKSEFPDAFTLISLKQWCEQRNEPVHIVGCDDDLKAFCEGSAGLLHRTKVEDFLDIINREDIAAKNVVALLERESLNVREILTDALVEADYDSEGLLEAFVTDTSGLEVQLLGSRLILLEPGAATFELTIEVSGTFGIECLDEEQSCWDKEEQSYLFETRKTIYSTEQFSTRATVKIVSANEFVDANSLQVVSLNGGHTIMLQVDDDCR